MFYYRQTYYYRKKKPEIFEWILGALIFGFATIGVMSLFR